ncbi:MULTISPECIES: hypothetical protein [unclassified Neochlamydia]|uniref:hypothetical protein n=1 Tax=unclassified Neochlamydia TaxID=2643326 RepID=UPI001408375F|nr:MULTISPECIES: hypothetical protein [unclassified Neochlamydia]MBS4166435.1 Uncharacterized protein [Neochlamydia sp. AcF65]MBS4169328.1 Uncharacterized protein [Neochlamydia sp. AcF95]NGY95653.1 hypothetical protein [Neochlamydia sp. AcF84]
MEYTKENSIGSTNKRTFSHDTCVKNRLDRLTNVEKIYAVEKKLFDRLLNASSTTHKML